MTARERIALVLVVSGAAAVTGAAGGLGGRWWALAVGGGTAAVTGVLLGLDTPDSPPAAAADWDGYVPESPR